MKDQHKQIKGYRDLSQEEIDLMNKIKMVAEEVGELVEEVQTRVYNESRVTNPYDRDEIKVHCEAICWADTAKQDLQLGFMQLVRAVAKPQSF